jgi:hypothetical protein
MILATLRVNEQEVARVVQKWFRDVVPRVLASVRGTLRDRFAALTRDAVLASPEYASLVGGGRLQAELGVTEPGPAVESVIEALQAAILVETLPVRVGGGSASGGVRVSLLKADVSDALSAEGVSYESEGGDRVDWLEWLLTAGDAVVITGHYFQAGFPEFSRTGLGFMSKGRFRTWAVPAEFSGTANSNWLTRALEAASARFGPVFAQALQEGFARA